MDGDWISAARAYELVSGALCLGAATAICSRANDDLIKARARRLIWGDRVLDYREIPAHFWWARGEAALAQNWRTGDFETWINNKIHCRAYGVEFRREDIEAMLPVPTTGRSEAADQTARPTGETMDDEMRSPPSSAGRRLSERWRPWIAELVAYVHENGIPEGVGSQGQEELIQAVADALAERGEEGLGRSTVQPVVQAVLERLRAAEN